MPVDRLPGPLAGPLAGRLVGLLDPWLAPGPSYAALAAGLRSLALDGRLPVGTRVPSERELAAALSVSRTTVSAAYDVLRGEGFLRSNRGAGSRVALPVALPRRPESVAAADDGILDLTVAALPAPAAIVDIVARAAQGIRPLLADHGLHPLGLPVLRAEVARHLSARGLATSDDQVVVTAGALHGWDLVLRAFGRPGMRVLIEQPTYPAVIDAALANRVRPVPLAVSAAGWDLPAAGARLAHVTADAQNPTGLLATAAQRRALLHALRGTLVVADETFADLVLEGRAPPPLGTFDRGVVTIGSMSKAFWAGLRIGWIRAEHDTLARIAQARAGLDLASPVLDQLVAAELLRAAPAILPERRALLRESRDHLVAALANRLPDWRVITPMAGMVVWAELPDRTASRVAAHALDVGLRVTPGPRFTQDGTGDRWLRLPYTLPFTSPGDRADEVVAMLAEAVMRVRARRVPASEPARWTA